MNLKKENFVCEFNHIKPKYINERINRLLYTLYLNYLAIGFLVSIIQVTFILRI